MTSAAIDRPVKFAKRRFMRLPRRGLSRPSPSAGGPRGEGLTACLLHPARGSGTAQEIAGDDDALDLVGALVDLRDLGVAHEALHRILARVAVAAEDLYGVGGHLHGGIAG